MYRLSYKILIHGINVAPKHRCFGKLSMIFKLIRELRKSLDINKQKTKNSMIFFNDRERNSLTLHRYFVYASYNVTDSNRLVLKSLSYLTNVNSVLGSISQKVPI